MKKQVSKEFKEDSGEADREKSRQKRRVKEIRVTCIALAWCWETCG
jgi:hypothetical protein